MLLRSSHLCFLPALHDGKAAQTASLAGTERDTTSPLVVLHPASRQDTAARSLAGGSAPPGAPPARAARCASSPPLQWPSDDTIASLWDLHRLPREKVVEWFKTRRMREQRQLRGGGGSGGGSSTPRSSRGGDDWDAWDVQDDLP